MVCTKGQVFLIKDRPEASTSPSSNRADGNLRSPLRCFHVVHHTLFVSCGRVVWTVDLSPCLQSLYGRWPSHAALGTRCLVVNIVYIVGVRFGWSLYNDPMTQVNNHGCTRICRPYLQGIGRAQCGVHAWLRDEILNQSSILWLSCQCFPDAV